MAGVRRLTGAIERIHATSQLDALSGEIFPAIDKGSTFMPLLAPHVPLASGKFKRLDTLQKTLDSIPFPTPARLQQAGFTPRESEILLWVTQGRRGSEIATILSEMRKVSLRTINNHLRNIIAKTGAKTRTEACLEVLDRIKRMSFQH